MMACDGEVPPRAVDLDSSSSPAGRIGERCPHKNMQTLTRWRPFRVAFEAINDRRSPRFEIAAYFAAMIEVDSRKWIATCEDEPDSIQLQFGSSCPRLPIAPPSGWISTTRRFTRHRRDRQLGVGPVDARPTDPLP